MTILELQQKLESNILEFKDNTQSAFQENSTKPATEGDLNELARQTLYALDKLKDDLIEYVKLL